MNLVQLVALWRELAKDTGNPYLWAEPDVIKWASEAEDQACIRARLIIDERTIALSTPDEPTLEEGSGTLSADTYSYRVSAYNASGETLASTKATILVGADASVTVTWEAIDGATGYKIYGRTDGAEKLLYTADEFTLSWEDDGSEDESTTDPPAVNSTFDVVKINVKAGKTIYPVHSSICEIDYASIVVDSQIYEVEATDYDVMDDRYPGWQGFDARIPRFYQFLDKHIKLFDTPDEDYTMMLRVSRKNLNPMSGSGATASAAYSPEIHEDHHFHLVDWIDHRAFGKKDADTYDQKRSDEAEKKFTKYFGPAPNADRKKRTEANQPHRTKAWW